MKACAFPGCGRPHKARGYCSAHVRQIYRGEDPHRITIRREKPQSPSCTFPGCGRPHKAKGLCLRHRKQQLAGEQLHPIPRSTAVVGSRNGMAKLDQDRVRSIREAYASGRWTQRELAEVQGISRPTVGNITRGELWRGITTRSDKAPGWPSTRSISPYFLIQEHPTVREQPWRILLACMLCNRTHGRHALPILLDIVACWPTPADIVAVPLDILEVMLRPLGFHRMRARRIRKMCREMQQCEIDLFPHRFTDVRFLYGVGEYAQDSWNIFVLGRFDIEPRDRELAKWVEWRRGSAG